MGTALVPNNDKSIDFPPPDGPVDRYFPLIAALPADDTFEIGLVLGGTVSAAAYTAGVIDFLIQALDAWTLAKLAGTAPQHKVRIKIAAGASGGAITCVLLARILASAFPHCDASTPPAQRAANPLYDNWVNQVDITDLLQLTDLANGVVHSLLCADKLDRVGEAIENYAGQPLGSLNTPPKRDYVEDHLPLVLTVTNLRGIPYSTDFRGNGRSEYYTDYADHLRFLVDVSGIKPLTAADVAPHAIGIGSDLTAGLQPWSTIILAARGSSAFPIGLPPKVLTRPSQQYRYRYAVIDDNGTPTAVWMRPAWPYMIPIGAGATTPYRFLTADGGCFNNEPTEFARQALAGVLGRNARDGSFAHRAVLLVDPFADTPDLGLSADPGLLRTGGATLSAFKNGTRYETADLDLFTDEGTFSRFLVNPVRTVGPGEVRTGGDAIATDTLAAFGGFLSASFREHDYLLGRRNCQQFLRKSFVLKDDNSLFANWTPAQRAHYGAPQSAGPGFLPIVPLAAALEAEIPQPPWPKGTFKPASIRALLDARIKKVAALSADSLLGSVSWPLSWGLDLAVSKLGDTGADKIVAAIESALKQADLL
ncbi:MAG TPA: hypothetical protein VGB91_12945 [Rhizomicrobium sp.]